MLSTDLFILKDVATEDTKCTKSDLFQGHEKLAQFPAVTGSRACICSARAVLSRFCGG